MSINAESGLRRHRTEFARENIDADGDPVTPANPAYELFSDTVRAFEWEPGPNVDPQRGLGDYDPNDHFRGPEEHSITVTYDLQRWFVDGAGAPNDASYDGMVRDADGLLPNTHTLVDRENKGSVAAASTWEGDARRATRQYTVGTGAAIDEVTVTGDPGDQQPVAVELSYECERVRTYQIDQPDAATLLAVRSTDAADTTQTLTIENEGAGTVEDVPLDGTTLVSTAATFGDIDSLSLDAETQGDVLVFINSGDGTAPAEGAQLSVLRGENSYEDVEGDLGIPALGTGSHAAAVGTAYERFLGDEITRAGIPLAMDVNSFELTVSNNTERTLREDSFAQRIHAGNRDTEVAATVLGETESHQQIETALTNEGADIVWTLTGGTLTVENARLTDPGSRSVNAGEATMSLDNTFTGEGLVIA